MSRAAAAAALSLALVGTVWSDAWGQAPKQGPAPKAGEPAKLAVPDATRLAILVQTAVVAASQANLTGNYTVLHALGSPGFQQANPPEKLAQVFADWRAKKIDLTPVIIFSPVLAREPVITDKNMLRLTGYYKTEPQQVHFDLLFQAVAGQWRLFGIALNTAPATPPASAPPPDADKKKPPPAKK